MRPLPLLALLWIAAGLCAAEGAFAAEGTERFDRGWLACTADTDCTTVGGACGGWVAANVEHAARMKAYQEQNAPYVECSGTAERRVSANASCQKGFCIA